VRSLTGGHYLAGNRRTDSCGLTMSPHHGTHNIIAVKEATMNNHAAQLVSTFSAPSPLLRRALLTDATLTALAGVAMSLAVNPLAELLDLPAVVLRMCGLFFIPFALLTAWLGTRDRVYRPLVLLVISLNTLVALDLVILLMGGWVETNILGEMFIGAHAVTIAVLAEMEFIGLRRSTQVEVYARR
jgi:hypothetical protein